MSASVPTLLAVAHGTREPAGAPAIAALLAGVRKQLPGVIVDVAYVDVQEPRLERVLLTASGPVVLVPLFLASGYHVRVDIPTVVATVGRSDVSVADPLGPDPAVVAAVADRHAAAMGPRLGDAIVLAAAGSSDARARADVELAAARLRDVLTVSVAAAYITSAEPRVAEAVAALRTDGCRSVSIATYLLAPGMFTAALQEAGADAVAAPIGDHPEVVALIVRRYLATVDGS
jgi:sirohydrochlorin ferrochelatase